MWGKLAVKFSQGTITDAQNRLKSAKNMSFLSKAYQRLADPNGRQLRYADNLD